MYFRLFGINTVTSLNAYFCLSLWAWMEWQICVHIQKTQVKNSPLLGVIFTHLSLGQERRACSKTTFLKNIETTVLLSVGTMQNWFVTSTDFFFLYNFHVLATYETHTSSLECRCLEPHAEFCS